MPSKKEKSVPHIGRPPAPWLYEVLKLDLPDDSFLNYQELSERCKVNKNTLYAICKKMNVPEEYYKTPINFIGRRFRLSDLKSAIRAYLKLCGRA